MARKVIDIIYNLVRKRMTLKGDGKGITSLPRPDQVERGMKAVFEKLKEGGLNPVSADKIIKNEDDLARILEEINQKQIADIAAKQKATQGIERVFDKMRRNIPLNPDDQAALQGSGFKTALDNFKGFEPKVIEGGKDLTMKTRMGEIPYIESPTQTIMQGGKKVPVKIPKGVKDDVLESFDNVMVRGEDTKYDADVLATDLAERRGFIKEGQDATDMDQKDYSKLYSEAYSFLTKSRFLNKPKKAAGGLIKAMAKLKKKFGKDIIQKGKAPKDKGGRKKLKQMFEDFNKRTKKEGGGLAGYGPYQINKQPSQQGPMGPTFETNDPKEALKEVLTRMEGSGLLQTPLGGGFSFDTGIGSRRPVDAGISFNPQNPKFDFQTGIGIRDGKPSAGIQFRMPFKDGGGLAYMLGEPREEMAAGGVALRRLLQFLSEGVGKKGSQGLKEMKVPKQMKFFAEKQGFNPDQARIDYLEQVLESLKADKKLIKGLEPSSNKDAMEEVADSLFKTEFVDKTQSGRFRGLDSDMIDSSIMELETILKNLKTKGQGRKLNADGGRIGFADGGMSRRTFLKIMAALASFPVVGKLAKTTKVAKGAAPIITSTAEMPEHFPKLVEKILREGQVVDSQFVKKTGNVKTYRHPDRPDIELTVEGEGDRIQLDFDTDQGMRGGYEFKKGVPDEMNPKPPADFEAGEVKYRSNQDGSYSKDFELGIDTGTENLDEFAGVGKQKTSKSKINLPESDDYADGGLAGLLGE